MVAFRNPMARSVVYGMVLLSIIGLKVLPFTLYLINFLVNFNFVYTYGIFNESDIESERVLPTAWFVAPAVRLPGYSRENSTASAFRPARSEIVCYFYPQIDVVCCCKPLVSSSHCFFCTFCKHCCSLMTIANFLCYV